MTKSEMIGRLSDAPESHLQNELTYLQSTDRSHVWAPLNIDRHEAIGAVQSAIAAKLNRA